LTKELNADKDLNVTLETLKLLQENLGKTPETIGVENYVPIAQEIRELTNGTTPNLSFCTYNSINTRIKRQPAELEKIFASYSTDKNLASKIYKKLK
jgi:hypothetical protein